MAKIALCGYGHDGRGLGASSYGYAYVVNDNVNVGDKLQVIATNWKSGKKFATTASPLETHRENSKEGQEVKSWAQQDSADGEINVVQSGKELGVKGFRGSKTYQEQTRANALQEYASKHPQAEFSKNANKLMEKGTYQSFDEYSSQFNKENK